MQSAGVSPFFGGVQMTWTEEAQTRTETEPQFKMMELKAHELSGYAVSSNVLLQDAAFGLEKFLMTLFGKAIGWFEEYAFLQGNGVGKPLGILNAAGRHRRQPRPPATRSSSPTWPTMLSQAAAQLAAAGHLGHASLRHRPARAAGRCRRAASSGCPTAAASQDNVPGTLFGLPVITIGKGAGARHQGRLHADRPAALRHRRPHADRDRRQRARQLPQERRDDQQQIQSRLVAHGAKVIFLLPGHVLPIFEYGTGMTFDQETRIVFARQAVLAFYAKLQQQRRSAVVAQHERQLLSMLTPMPQAYLEMGVERRSILEHYLRSDIPDWYLEKMQHSWRCPTADGSAVMAYPP